MKNRKTRITKISDNMFDGNHPNGIFEGYIRSGFELFPPTLESRYTFTDGFSTSPITQLPDENGIFKTLNSTYKLEYLD